MLTLTIMVDEIETQPQAVGNDPVVTLVGVPGFGTEYNEGDGWWAYANYDTFEDAEQAIQVFKAQYDDNLRWRIVQSWEDFS